MNIADHIAAPYDANWHRWHGVTAGGLAAVVGTSILATFTSESRELSRGALVAHGLEYRVEAYAIFYQRFVGVAAKAEHAAENI